MSDIPEVIGPYELGQRLGAGGMGAVYRARHRMGPFADAKGSGREVALKLLTVEGEAQQRALARFRREARILADLDHPGIVRVLDIGEDGGRHYIAMELIEGENLAEHLAHEPPLLQRSLSLMAAIARAVGHVHERGYVHRDLKPQNVLIDREGRPHVSDFGLGRAVDSTTRLTQTQQIVGTPYYIAPELLVADGPREPGPAADVFSLGVMLYELLTGRRPFQGESTIRLFQEIVHFDPPAPVELAPHLPEPASAICLKALCKNPRHRYAGGTELAEDLERLLRGEPMRGRTEPLASRLWRRLRRHPVKAVACVATGLGVLAGAFIVQNVRPSSSAAVAVAVARMKSELTAAAGPDGRRVVADALKDRLALALVAQRGPQLVELLLPELHNELAAVREVTARALAPLDDPRAIEPLLAALEREPELGTQTALAEAAAALAPGDPRVRDAIILASEARKGAREAFQAALAALDETARGNDIEHELRAGALLINQGRLEAAVAHYTAMLARWPGQDGALNNRGVAYRRLGRFDLAVADFSAILAGRPDDVDVLNNRGLARLNQGEEALARADFARALQLDPRSTVAYYNRACAHLGAGRWEQALADLDRCLEIDPGYVAAINDRGKAYVELGKLEAARDCFTQVIERNPADAAAWTNRGVVHGRMGLMEQMFKDYDQALRVDPGYRGAYGNRAEAHVRAGDLRAALADYDRALELKSDDPAMRLRRARCQAALDAQR